MTTSKIFNGDKVFAVKCDEDGFSISTQHSKFGYDIDTRFLAEPLPIFIAPGVKLDVDEGPLFRTLYIECEAQRFDNGVTVDFGVYREPLYTLSCNGVHGPNDPDFFNYQ